MLPTLVALAYFTGACSACNPAFDKTALAAKEAVLREDLRVMRGMIKEYAHDKGVLPQSLEDLAGAGYIRSIPEDPMTGKRDWKVTVGEDPELAKGSKGIVDVHSSSPAKSSGGTPYSEW
jgi:general secretion pathway protein G